LLNEVQESLHAFALLIETGCLLGDECHHLIASSTMQDIPSSSTCFQRISPPGDLPGDDTTVDLRQYLSGTVYHMLPGDQQHEEGDCICTGKTREHIMVAALASGAARA